MAIYAYIHIIQKYRTNGSIRPSTPSISLLIKGLEYWLYIYTRTHISEVPNNRQNRTNYYVY